MTVSSDQSLPEGIRRSPFSVDPGEEAACTVCTDPVRSDASALCSQCGDPYHLVLTNDGEGKDCGEVWLNEEFLALEFGCADCLAAVRGKASRPGSERGGGRARHEDRSSRGIVRRRRR